VRAVDLPLEVDFLGVRSYGDSTDTSGVVQITHDLSRPVEGRDVLLGRGHRRHRADAALSSGGR
jgi:hypoxanthine-guanine phosphoribosyltransferase